MKIPAKLVLSGCFATLAVTPLAFAEDGGVSGEIAKADPQAAVAFLESQSADPRDEPIIDETDNGAATDGDTVTKDDSSDDGNAVDNGDAVSDDSGDTEAADSDGGGKGTGAPSELERGGADPDVIFYNLGGEAPASGPAGAPLAKPALQGERGAGIERKEAVVPQVNREKKAPVALIKKGRIFLR